MPEVKDAQVGDEFCYMGNFGPPTIVKIVRITPKGQLVDNNGNRWKNGRRVGGNSWGGNWLSPVTDADRRKILRSKTYNYVARFNYNELPLESLLKIAKVVRECADEKAKSKEAS